MNKKELLKKAEELENKINEEKERVETITIEIEKMKKKLEELRLMLN